MNEKQRYVTIQEFMAVDLKLKNNDLLIYAIIFGFSQDGKTRYTGSRQYLADWTNSTRFGIDKNLASLIDKGLIVKYSETNNGVIENTYAVVLPPPIQKDSLL